MFHTNQILIREKYGFRSQQLIGLKLDDLEEKSPDEEPPEDLPYEQDLPENSERQNNITEESVPRKDSHVFNK